MSKNSTKRYTYNGTDESLRQAFRYYTLDSVLLKCSQLSAMLIQDKNSPEDGKIGNGAQIVKYKVTSSKTKVSEVREHYLTGWELVDCSYQAIKHTNDYCGESIYDVTKQYPEFAPSYIYGLIDVVHAYSERRESEFIDSNDVDARFLLYLWGFAGEQFLFETIANVKDEADRELYIIFDCGNKLYPDIDFEQIVRESIGVSPLNVLSTLFYTWALSSKMGIIDNLIPLAKWDDILTQEDFKKVIDYYTATYKDVRESALGRQFFYSKPFIRTDRSKNIISINCYLNLFAFEHCIFWIIRDHYLKRDSQEFTSQFGEMFECYFAELLSECLKDGEYRRIPETAEKRADWEMNIDGFHFLIEQKAALLGLMAKQQESDVNTTVTYCKRHFYKALTQLRNTEDAFKKAESNNQDIKDIKENNDGTVHYLKVILLYDTYLQPEVLESVLALPDCPVEDDRYYWCINIREMEQLLWLCKTDRVKFDEVIKTRIDRSVNTSKDGKSASSILSEIGIAKDGYLNHEKFTHYYNEVYDNIRDHLH